MTASAALSRAPMLGDRALQALLVGALLVLLGVFVVLPVATLAARSLFDADGGFVGAANFVQYLNTPALADSAWRSVRLAALSAAICVAVAYVYAYALTLSAMPAKGLFRAVALLPLLAPSLLMAISLVYLFGNQGLLKGWFGIASIYGETGIVIGSVLWTFPHALLVLVTALATTDARLYEAAATLGASRWRVFLTVTLPASRYGLLMAFVVVFVLVITDFGVPKVIGGPANVLATDLYKQVVGQQNLRMGAVVGVVLLLPAVLAFVLERQLRRRQAAALTVRAVPYVAPPHAPTDRALLVFCAAVAFALLAVIGVAFFASVATYWPYNLTPSLKNYDFDQMDGGGWATYGNSLRMAALVAVGGAATVFVTAWLVEKPRHFGAARDALNLMATLPLAIPGLALGLGYILFFNHPDNPLRGLYATMAILVVCTVAHFLSVAHLTMLAALRQLDREYELVGESLGVPAWHTAWRVHLPVALPALLDVAGYFFVNAMTTVSAVVFLYAPHTQLASVAVLNMDDAGDVAPAAAMAVLIFVTAAVVRGAFALASRALLARTQRWRRR
ncbi:MAG: putative 2-aminoethylphosphonate ABC transporter permease subunit [Rubrivivax sp.]|nr:putative 2-aminoethylphosphonate ABC transporter permease subunit [Rubrivivax sp.]